MTPTLRATVWLATPGRIIYACILIPPGATGQAATMIPVGYMFKKVVLRPDWLTSSNVNDIYSLSGCVS